MGWLEGLVSDHGFIRLPLPPPGDGAWSHASGAGWYWRGLNRWGPVAQLVRAHA